MVVASGLSGAGDPLVMARRTDHRIPSYRVARLVVKVMRPLVDRGGARLDDLLPASISLDIGYAVGSQNPHHFAHGDIAAILDDHEVDQILGIR